MASTEKQAFDEFDEALKLDTDERDAAQALHKEIADLLISSGLAVSAFLQGSLARATMIAPLRDVDKVVILRPSLREELSMYGSADRIMDQFQDLLAVQFPKATFDRTKHSLKMTVAEESFTFDIVPAFETTSDDDDVEIANRESTEWTRSNTRALMRVVAKRNKATYGRFVHQVRMVKHMIRHLLDGELPGLHVESIAYQVVQDAMDYAEAVTLILEAGVQLIASGYDDPTGVERISEKLKPEVRLRSETCLRQTARRAREARNLADAGDYNASIAIWFDLFGEPFPSPQQQSVDDAFAMSFGGSITSAGTASATKAGRQTAPPVRSWRR